LAAYVAGGIAGADINKVGWTAAAYALPSFILPFAFAFGPGLLENIAAIVTSGFGIFAIVFAVVGVLKTRINMVARAGLALAGSLLLFQDYRTAIAGAALFAAITLVTYTRPRAVLPLPKQ
jgi:TRAP-type uncharacterized transport system fused permease subunit